MSEDNILHRAIYDLTDSVFKPSDIGAWPHSFAINFCRNTLDLIDQLIFRVERAKKKIGKYETERGYTRILHEYGPDFWTWEDPDIIEQPRGAPAFRWMEELFNLTIARGEHPPISFGSLTADQALRLLRSRRIYVQLLAHTVAQDGKSFSPEPEKPLPPHAYNKLTVAEWLDDSVKGPIQDALGLTREELDALTMGELNRRIKKAEPLPHPILVARKGFMETHHP